MSENKRFKLFVGNNYGVQTVDGEVIIDSIISIGDADVLVGWLNEITEENEQLKKENKELGEELDCIWDSYENYYGMSIRNTEWYGFKGDVE